MNRTKPQLRTPITYYGGKVGMLNHILPLIPVHGVYTEVFFGGGAVFFAKFPAKNETINDKMDVVINFYRQLKTNYDELKSLIDQTIYSRTLYKKACMYLCKGSKASDTEKAWAFFFQINAGFAAKYQSGMGYSNEQGTSRPVIFSNKKKRITRDLLKRIEHTFIENDDAIKILRSRNTVTTFHYQDPPYPGADQGHYAGYDWDEYKKLLDFNQDECKGKFLLSNYNSEMLQEYIDRNGWRKKEIHKRITAVGPNIKKNGTEVLVWNYDETRGQLNMFNNAHH